MGSTHSSGKYADAWRLPISFPFGFIPFQGYVSHPDATRLSPLLQEVGKLDRRQQRTRRKKEMAHKHELRLFGAAVREGLTVGSL